MNRKRSGRAWGEEAPANATVRRDVRPFGEFVICGKTQSKENKIEWDFPARSFVRCARAAAAGIVGIRYHERI